jgi:stage III sporulation protein AE
LIRLYCVKLCDGEKKILCSKIMSIKHSEVKMKRNLIKVVTRIVILLLLACTLTLCVSAAGSDEIVKEQSQKSGADSLYNNAPDKTKKDLNKLGIKSPDVLSISNFTPQGMFKLIVEKLKSSVTAPLKAMTAVFGILLLCALLGTMKNSFGEKPLKQVFDIVCALCIAAALIVSVTQCISSAASTIEQSSNFMLTFLPVFVGLVAASGHPASAITYQGILIVSSQVISQISSTTFVPMVNIYLAFCVIGSVSPGVKISGIAGFARKIVDFGLALCLTIFTGILTIQGLISQAADTVTMKTAKFVVGSVIPIVGNSISEAMNTVVSCANLLKTLVGAYAIIVFLLAFLSPVLECLLWMLAVDISLVIADILGIESVIGLLKSVKEALRMLISLVLAVALAMIISVSVMLMLGMGN